MLRMTPDVKKMSSKFRGWHATIMIQKVWSRQNDLQMALCALVGCFGVLAEVRCELSSQSSPDACGQQRQRIFPATSSTTQM